MDDRNLGDPVRLPGAGWSDVGGALDPAQVHVWNHFTEAKLRIGGTSRDPDPAVTQTALQSLVTSMPIAFDSAAASEPFVAQVSIGGPGGGRWAIDVREGACTVTEGPALTPDLAMGYRDADSFAAAAFKAKHPMVLMLTGRLKVKGMAKMGTFAKLFPSTPSN